MKQLPQEKSQQKPSIIATLSNGFDHTTRNIWIILLPFVMDLFYWIGPRLSIEELFESSAATLQNEPAFAGVADQMLQMSTQFNLFTSLSIPIIGIPALMGGTVPEKTPVLSPTIQVEDPLLWLMIFFLLTLAGLLISTIYFGLIALILRKEGAAPLTLNWGLVTAVSLAFVRLLGLGVVFVASLIAVWIPLVPLALLAGLLGANIFYMVLVVGVIIVITYLSLSVPAIVLAKRPLIKAIRESVTMAHGNLMSLVGLLLVVVIVNSGTNLLWHMADNGSWITLISLAGNSFISTALFVAIFIFYRDRSDYDIQVKQERGI